MRQGDGADVLDANDTRNSDIGIIYVAPNDDRQSVLAAILTQDKLGRKQVAVVLPEDNKAFQRPVDFDGLKNMRRGLKTQIVIVAPGGRGPAEFARQRRFPVYSSMENYAKSLQEEEPLPDAAKKGWLFGRKQKPLSVPPPASAGRRERTQPLTPDQMGQRPQQPDAAADLDEEPEQRRGVGAAGVAGAAGVGLAAGMMARRSQEPEAANPNQTMPPDFEEEDWNTFPPPPDFDSEDFIHPLDEEDPGTIEAEEDRPRGAALASAAAAGAAGGLAASEGGPEAIKFPSTGQARGRDTVELNKKPTDATPAESDATMILPPAADAPARKRNAGRALAAAGLGIGAGVAAASVANAQTAGKARNAGSAAAVSNSAAGTPPPPVRPRQGQGGPGGRQRRRGGILLVLILLFLLLILGFSFIAYAAPGMLGPLARVVPGVTSGATISITPANTHLVKNYVITAVNNPDSNPNSRQVRSRVLTFSTPAQTKTVPATDHRVLAAQAATGKITFYNLNPTDVTVIGGTDFIVGRIHVITDSAVDVPGANLPTAGTASVSAHSSVPGTIGNISAGVINRSCCGSGVAAKNNSDFSGGQDAQNYLAVGQSDIDGAANPLEAAQLVNAQKGLEAQLHQNERVIGSASCNPKLSSDHQAGDKASNVTVTVSETCRAIVYDHDAAQSLSTTLLKQDATTNPGSGYALVGDVVTTVTPGLIADPKTGKVSLLVKAEGIWVYQIDDARKHDLIRMIAGKSKKDAQALLLQQPGIAKVDIQYDGDSLPNDPGQLSFSIQNIPGLQASPTPGPGTPTIPISGSPTSSTSQGNG